MSSSDGNATLGYGLKITNKKLLKTIDYEDENIVGEDFVCDFGGDTLSNNVKVFLLLKISICNAFIYSGGADFIHPAELFIQSDWDVKLRAWAKKHKVIKPKIGWWLLTSI